MSAQDPIRKEVRTPGILFEQPAASCCKSLTANSFLFEWKTTA